MLYLNPPSLALPPQTVGFLGIQFLDFWRVFCLPCCLSHLPREIFFIYFSGRALFGVQVHHQGAVGAGGGDHGLAGGRVEHGCVVQVLLVVVLGGRVAAALLGDDVHHDGALGREFDCVAEGGLEFTNVMSIDGADVSNAERFEERRWLQEFPHGGLHGLWPGPPEQQYLEGPTVGRDHQGSR